MWGCNLAKQNNVFFFFFFFDLEFPDETQWWRWHTEQYGNLFPNWSLSLKDQASPPVWSGMTHLSPSIAPVLLDFFKWIIWHKTGGHCLENEWEWVLVATKQCAVMKLKSWSLKHRIFLTILAILNFYCMLVVSWRKPGTFGRKNLVYCSISISGLFSEMLHANRPKCKLKSRRCILYC